MFKITPSAAVTIVLYGTLICLDYTDQILQDFTNAGIPAVLFCEEISVFFLKSEYLNKVSVC